MGNIVLSMDWLYDILKKRQANKYDCIVVFDGARGTGKSTSAVYLANLDETFNMKNDIVFSRRDVMEQLSTKTYGIIVADEMINVTHNRDFYNEEQKKLIRHLNMFRDSCNILICCVPNFFDLDKQFRSLVKFRVNVVRRGVGILHMPIASMYVSDSWDTKHNEKIERNWVKSNSYNVNYSKLSTYKGMIRLPNLGVIQRVTYEMVKKEKRGHVVSADLADGKDKKMNVYEAMVEVLTERGMTKEEIDAIAFKTKRNPLSIHTSLNKELRGLGRKERVKAFINPEGPE